jgi:hypothetical protein
MRICRGNFLLLVFCFSAMSSMYSDYALEPVETRFILLLEGRMLRVEGTPAKLSIRGIAEPFVIDGMFLQDRIASQGIDVGDFDASLKRIEEVKQTIKAKSGSKILVEIVRTKGTKKHVVSYLKVFDATAEYARYADAAVKQDRIELPVGAKPPSSADGFARLLEEISTRNFAKLLESCVEQK